MQEKNNNKFLLKSFQESNLLIELKKRAITSRIDDKKKILLNNNDKKILSSIIHQPLNINSPEIKKRNNENIDPEKNNIKRKNSLHQFLHEAQVIANLPYSEKKQNLKTFNIYKSESLFNDITSIKINETENKVNKNEDLNKENNELKKKILKLENKCNEVFF